MYYKIINNNNIVGVATSINFRKYQKKHGVILFSNENDAEYIESNNVLYHDDWLKALQTYDINYISAQIIQIDINEYEFLKQSFEEMDQIPVEEDTPIEEDIDEIIEENQTLEFIKESKIKYMSYMCKSIITSGFDIVLSDGESHHFSMEIEDQIKIQTLAMKAQSGQQLLPWHSDGELCVFYPAEDILSIYNELEKLQTFHTTYFNSLKYYIESLDTVEGVNSIYYGINIPEEYQSEVLKYLLRQNNENGN